ncbi:MAG: CHASE3 domain-containing protein, partial [Oleibacter sp.]|nr:CHASE3 domain-containing protein [Thalassolituus sp.]
MNKNSLSLTKKLMLGFAVPVVCIMIIAGIVHKNTSNLLISNGWVNHTHEAIRDANLIMAAMVDRETGMRGFLVTGVDEFLEPYIKGGDAFKEKITALKQKVSDNPPQVERLQAIESMAAQWVSNVAEPAIALRRTVSLESDPSEYLAVWEFAKAGKGKKSMDGIRTKIAEFIAIENKLIDVRIADASSLVASTNFMTLLGSLITLVISAVLGFYIVTNIKSDVGGEPSVISGISKKIADGDLTISSHGQKVS